MEQPLSTSTSSYKGRASVDAEELFAAYVEGAKAKNSGKEPVNEITEENFNINLKIFKKAFPEIFARKVQVEKFHAQLLGVGRTLDQDGCRFFFCAYVNCRLIEQEILLPLATFAFLEELRKKTVAAHAICRLAVTDPNTKVDLGTAHSMLRMELLAKIAELRIAG